MSDQQQGQSNGNILQEFSLVLLGAAVNGSQKQPRLTFGVYKNRPTIAVKTNLQGDSEDGRIRAEPRIPDFFALLSALKDLIATPGERKIPITLKARKFINKQMSQDKMLASISLVGRDANDVIYIAVRSWNKDRPVIKFPFLPTNDNFSEASWGDPQGNPLDNAKLSEYYTDGWVTFMQHAVPHLLVAGYKPPPPRDGGGSGGGGGGNYNNNNNGGNRNQGGGGNSYNNRGGGGGGSSGGGAEDFSFADDDLPI